MIDWSLFPHFQRHEFACQCGKCGGAVEMRPEFMEALQRLREAYGKPMVITSGYRCPLHPIKTPEHRMGMAADIAVRGAEARKLLPLAWEFPRWGISQHGRKRFIHLGLLEEGVQSPWIWSYP